MQQNWYETYRIMATSKLIILSCKLTYVACFACWHRYMEVACEHDYVACWHNTPVSSYDGVTSLCRCSSVSEMRKVFVYVNGGTDAA